MATAMSAGCLISPEPLLEQFNCPVCLNVMKDVWVTTCFHRFCENCIKESVNAAHRCPLCNKALQQDNLQRDAQFNSLLEAIDKGIQQAEKEKAKTFANQIVDQIGDSSIRSILEELFRDTLVTSLANHLTSENDMRCRYKRKKTEIESVFNREIEDLKSQGLSKEEYKRQLDAKTVEFRRSIDSLDNEIRNVQILFIQAYKNHLNEHVSNFAAVSTQVNVTLWKDDRLMKQKDGQYLVKLLRPEERMADLLPHLAELVQLYNDKIVKFGEMILFTCISPLDDQSEENVLAKLRRIDDDNDDDLLTVSQNCRPILEHKLLRGTLVVIHGDILLESEVPKKCFIQIFNENPNREHSVDYFECRQCLRNNQPLRWICRSCAIVCHKSKSNEENEEKSEKNRFYLSSLDLKGIRTFSFSIDILDHHLTPLMFGNKASSPKCDCRKKNCVINPR